MHCADLGQVIGKLQDERLGEQGDTILFAFAVADGDLQALAVEILDANMQAFHQAHAVAVGQLADEQGESL